MAGEPFNTSDLYVMNTDGTEQIHLLRGSSATWSADIKNIAFHASASGTGLPIRFDPGAPATDSDLFVLNVDDWLAGTDTLANRLRLKHAPELTFLYDESIERQDRIEKIILDIQAERAENPHLNELVIEDDREDPKR